MPVRGLTIVLGEPAPARLRTALVLLMAQAALGGRARLFLEGAAVALLAAPLADAADVTSYGQLPLAAMWDEALTGGVEVVLCQTGMQMAGLTADRIDPRLHFGGPVSLLQSLAEDRLVLG